jgi:hypothetical protein
MAKDYSGKPSRPAMPIRLMVGVLMLKHLRPVSYGNAVIPREKMRQFLYRNATFLHRKNATVPAQEYRIP